MSTAIQIDPIIEISALMKYFNHGEIKAVDGISLRVQKGEIFALLGPNGAGKSTAIRMLTTVLKPDSGTVTLDGLELMKNRERIRAIIGVCPQENVIYEELTAAENVRFVARMHDLSKEEAAARSQALLEKMGIAGREDKSKNFSGGMKRRLNLVMALVNEPRIAFLDEPTAGLDPQARRIVWDHIRDLKDTGMTVVLTTHDMVEAEAVSDHVAIIDQGKIIAFGTVDDLKEKFGSGNVLEITFFEAAPVSMVKEQLESLDTVSQITVFDDCKLLVTFSGGLKNFIQILQQGVIEHTDTIETINFRQNSLEDVFLHLTGRRLRE